jgi:hypothetical protein
VLGSWTWTNSGAKPPESTGAHSRRGSVEDPSVTHGRRLGSRPPARVSVTQRDRRPREFPFLAPPPPGTVCGRLGAQGGNALKRVPLNKIHSCNRTGTANCLLTLLAPRCRVAASQASGQLTGPSRPGYDVAGWRSHTGRTCGASGSSSAADVRVRRSATGASLLSGPRPPSIQPLSTIAPSAHPSSISHALSPVRAVPGLLHRAQPQRARFEHIGANDDLHHGAATCRRN